MLPNQLYHPISNWQELMRLSALHQVSWCGPTVTAVSPERSSGQYVEGHLKGENYLKTNWCVENKLFHYYFQDPLLVYRQGLGSPRQVGLKFYIAKDDLRLLLILLPLPLLGADYRQAPPWPLMQCWEWVHTREASILLTGPSHISDRLTDQTTSEKQPSLSNLSGYFPF